jgi:type I restriction enzyme S subunit
MNSEKFRVGDIIEVQRRQHKLKTNEYRLSGSVPIIDQGAEFIAGFTDEVDRAYGAELPVIIFGDHTCCLKFVDFRFAVGADGTQLLRPVKGIDARYLYYALHAVELEQFGYQRHFKLLKDCEVSVPPREIQHRVASILGAYDDLIEVNRRRVAVLEEMARGLFEEWFVRFRFPGHEEVPILDTPEGPLPEAWTWAALAILPAKFA